MYFVVTVANSQVPYKWGGNLSSYQKHIRQMNTHRACHLLTKRNSCVPCRHVNIKTHWTKNVEDTASAKNRWDREKNDTHTHTVRETVGKPIY